MPLNVPATENIAALSASEVWAYLPNRRLTSLAIPADIIKFVGKGTGTEVPSNKSLYDLVALDRLDHATYGLPALNNDLDTLLARLTALRAALLDNLVGLDATVSSRLPTSDFNTRLSSTRASYIDLLADPTVGLTALEALVDDLETRLTAARAGYLDYLPNQRVEVAQVPATQNAVAVLNTTNETTLGSKDITVDIPTGATIESVIALARISIMNDSATAQKIDLKLNVEAVTLFNQADVVGSPAADGASSIYTIAEDASDEVTSIGQVVTLEALATLSAAASVRFQAQYFLFITYRMGS